MKKVLCPFCFNKISVEKGVCCPIDGCPSKKNNIVLPEEVFTHKPFPIMVVGGKNSGKTVFLSALAYQLINSKFWGNFWDAKMIHYKKNNFDETIGKLFTHPYELPASTQKEGHKLPLLFSVTFKELSFKKTPLGFPRVLPTKLLVNFTDPAGEHFRLSTDNTESAKEQYKILKGHAKSAIAIMDPIEVNENWNEILSGKRITKIEEKGIVSASNALEMLTLMPKNTCRNLPLAICLTKLDEIVGSALKEQEISGIDFFSLGEEHNTYRQESGKISIPELEGVDKTIRRVLFKNRCNHIFNSIGIPIPQVKNEENPTEIWDFKTLTKATFRYHAFFGVSSLGRVSLNPSKDENGNETKQADKQPEPFRVLDPLLWILWQYGYIGATTKKTR